MAVKSPLLYRYITLHTDIKLYRNHGNRWLWRHRCVTFKRRVLCKVDGLLIHRPTKKQTYSQFVHTSIRAVIAFSLSWVCILRIFQLENKQSTCSSYAIVTIRATPDRKQTGRRVITEGYLQHSTSWTWYRISMLMLLDVFLRTSCLSPNSAAWNMQTLLPQANALLENC
jgi:hypothetical protein